MTPPRLETLSAIAQRHGDTFYLLDTRQFRKNYRDLLDAFRSIWPDTHIAYSYKTNYTPRLCKIIDEMGGAAEVVSAMELEIARRLGIPYSRIHYNGPCKDSEAMKAVIMGGGMVNLDDYAELPVVGQLASQYPDRQLNIGIRCNFPVGDGVTSRFGFDVLKPEFHDMLRELAAMQNIRVGGLQCHFASRALPTWEDRARGMVGLVNDHADTVEPDHIDLGGGLYGNMPQSLKEQFDAYIPTFGEYARQAATIVAQAFSPQERRPTLFIEPGSALAGDVMTFVAKVVSIKNIRGKDIATLTGSMYNINPTLNKKNPPIAVIHTGDGEPQHFADLDFAGYTCIESDYLYRHYNGPLAKGDFVAFGNAGSYSVVLKPPFILPNVPILETDGDDIIVVKRQETFDDLFATYNFNW